MLYVFFLINYLRCFLAKKYKYILRKFKTVKQTLKLSSRIYLLILLIRCSQYNFNLSFLGNLLSTLCSVSKEVVYWLDNRISNPKDDDEFHQNISNKVGVHGYKWPEILELLVACALELIIYGKRCINFD